MRKLMTDFHHRLEQEIPRLRRYARALTRNAVRADDLVQETLVRALRKEHLWQADTNLRLAFYDHAQPECKRL
jgi:RNA polymerase sigma-70 factor (ECF subfamily)